MVACRLWATRGRAKSDAICQIREVGDSSETRHLTEREERWDEDKSRVLSEVGFEPTPSEEDHDLNVAP